jgi:hypothetical protein
VPEPEIAAAASRCAEGRSIFDPHLRILILRSC